MSKQYGVAAEITGQNFSLPRCKFGHENCGTMDETAVYELQQLCTGGGLTQDSLSRLIDAGLSVPFLVRSDAAAMAQAKKAGLGMAERQALKEALRRTGSGCRRCQLPGCNPL